jgi:dienelactone hydrolase
MNTTTLTRRLKRETLVFGGAVLVALVHAFDDALGEAGDHTLAAVLSLVLAAGAVWAFPRVRTGLRAGLALFFGAAATLNGSMHVKHIAEQGVSGGDVTGVLAAAAGGVLVALAIALPIVHRGEGGWKGRAIAVPATLLGLFFVIVPMSIALTETHKWREDVGAAPSAAYRDVTFEASDGVQLSGWYRPTRNGATVIVVHGGGSDRRGSVAHASMLARHGYGVLLYDSRGRGRSEGTQNAWGWGWPRDVEGAIAYLKARPEVDPERLGALGLSTGADVLVQVAGTGHDLKAVVADGTVASSYEDAERVYGIGLMTPFFVAEFATVQLTSGTKPGPTLEDVMPKVMSPTLLVAAGPQEKRPGELYDRAAGDRPVDVWYLPNVSHTAAIRQAAPEYERRVTRFFAAALR